MITLTQLRITIFILGILLFSLLQLAIPRRQFIKNRLEYMLSNLLIVFINNFVVAMVVLIPLKAAEIAKQNGFGIFHVIRLSPWAVIILSIVILDVTIYFQHRIFHKIHFLWKLHSVHHIDPMLDTTSGLRFHPLEIIISNFIKVGMVLLIGAPAFAVFLFEVILSTTAMFNHSNFRIHRGLEKVLRMVLITPDLHLIHHSVKRKEMNSNYGFSVPWWDRLFGTYTPEPEVDYKTMPLGIPKMPEKKDILFPGLLGYPFKK